MRKTLRFIPLLALGLVAMAASTYSFADNMNVSKQTQNFVNNAAISDQFEIQSSKLALNKSTNDTVKKFAQQMIDDHTKASDQLKTTLNSANLAITPPADIDSKHQKMLDALNKKDNGADFDKAYVKDQNKAHDEAIKLFKNYAKNGDSTAVQTFAAQTLPILMQHKQMAVQLKVLR